LFQFISPNEHKLQFETEEAVLVIIGLQPLSGFCASKSDRRILEIREKGFNSFSVDYRYRPFCYFSGGKKRKGPKV